MVGVALTTVIPAAKDEPREWIQELVGVARAESNEVLLIVPAGSSIIASSVSGVTYTLAQQGTGKTDALHLGLAKARGQYVVFIDADVKLASGQRTIVHDMLDHGAEFVAASYGRRPPPFPILSQTSGWFFAANRDVFRSLGGWGERYLEGVATGRAIQKAGHRITAAPFSVELRRAPRNAPLKFLSAIFAKRT